jgi:hypothetical protein
MRRTILLAGVLPFISAFLGGVLAFGLVVPSMATAQSTVQQEVRANSFVLVNDSGAVVTRLGINPVGTGTLSFLRGNGTTSATLSQIGLAMWGGSGDTIIMRVGRCTGAGVSPTGCPGGLPPFEGVQLGPDASVGTLPSQ